MNGDDPVIHGVVEWISAKQARGWAWNPSEPRSAVEVELHYDGELVGSVRADQYRHDLEQSNIGNGYHGFVLEIRSEITTNELLQFRIVETDEPLSIAKTAFKTGVSDGFVECINDSGVFGWVWSPSDPLATLSVEVLESGKIIGRGVADVFRADLYAAGIGDGRHAFMAKLPGGQVVNLEKIEVRIAGTDSRLPISSAVASTPPPAWFKSGKPGETASAPPMSAAADGSTTQPPRPETQPKGSPTEAPGAAVPLPPGIRERDYKLMAAEFDSAFYKSRNSDAADAVKNPLDHFITVGWREGRSPASWFSIPAYLSHHADVLKNGINPFLHYVRDGRREGRAVENAPDANSELKFRRKLADITREQLDRNFYVNQVKDVDFQVVDPALHYLLFGWRQERDPCPWFSVKDYLTAYPDVKAAQVDPFSHYLDHGKAEGRQPTRRVRNEIESDFDVDFYLSQSPNLQGLDPIDHFVAFGWKEGRNPRRDFSVKHYLRMSPDVAKENINPFWHYVVAGKKEGRTAYPVSSRKIAPNPNLPTILFVGHAAQLTGAEIVLLEVIHWFADHTRYPLKLLLLGPGKLIGRYAEYADTFVMLDSLEDISGEERLKEFLKGKFLACYVNTVAAARFWNVLEQIPRLAQLPLILHVHEMEFMIREFENDFNKLRPYIDSIIAVSTAVRSTLTQSFDCDPGQIFLSNAFIHPRANTAYESAVKRQDARRDLQLSPTDFVIMGCGTVYPRKGPDFFLDAAFKCLERSSVENARFVWIGGGEELERHQKAAAAKGLGDRIRFVGARDNANELVAAGDVFFLSSREDPFPLVCLEAAQYGIPTIYFKGTTGISEFCRDDAGVGVEAFDTNAALEAIQRYANQRSRLERAGSAARVRLLDGYTADKRVLEIALHLRETCNAPPAVTVIVPTYNHERFVRERLDSVLRQTLHDIEVIVLDDCSTDDTVNVIREYAADPRVRLVTNKVNSGSPFIQWAAGIELARADFIWIAEGDDSVTDNFLVSMLPSFDDPAVNLAFCKTEIIDEFGARKHHALDPYYRMSEFPFSALQVKMDGLTAVERGFGTMCLIVNASSAVFRRGPVSAAVQAAKTFKMCGDWFVYLSVLSDGKLVYSADATNYFRRHSASAVHKLEGTPRYFDERLRIAAHVLEDFHVSRKTFRQIIAQLENEWARFSHKNEGLKKADVLNCQPLFSKFMAKADKKLLRVGLYVHGMLFSKGGIERLASQIANGLAQRGHTVYIFCREWGSAAAIYPLSESVKVVGVFNEGDLAQAVRTLRVEIAKRDLDVFVPMLSEWLFDPIVDACHGLGIPIIASEHNDPAKIEELWWSQSKRLACFSKVDAVHLLLARFSTSLPASFKSKIFTIPNGVVIDERAQLIFDVDRPNRIIGVGRLERQKRFDRLVHAFILASDRLRGWRLDIFGEGSERKMLQAIIDQNQMADRITLQGNSDNIPAEMQASAIFAMPSEFEGFGIVILEAKQAGLPSVAYASCNGPNELIKHEEDGLLVASDETGESLAEAFIYLSDNVDLRREMGQRAREHVTKFDIRSIVERWETMLETVVSRAVPKQENEVPDAGAPKSGYTATGVAKKGGKPPSPARKSTKAASRN